MNQTLLFENPGPIEGQFKIELNGPGLYELRGSKGTGKTTVLNCLSLLAGHKVAVTVHDGELSGKVEGFGVVVPLGSRKRPRGECELDTLDTEKFDLVDLIDPQGKTPKTRDAVRIKALASLCNLRLSPADFHELAGGKQAFDAFGISETDDPVLYAQRVKDAIDAEAKTSERLADTELGRVKSLEEQVEGVDISVECDADVLSKTRETAVVKLSRLTEQKSLHDEQSASRDNATTQLEAARKSYTGPSAAQASQAADERREAVADHERAVAKLKEQLADAERCLAEQKSHLTAAAVALSNAEQHEHNMQAWESTIAASESTAPSAEQLAAAEAELQSAKQLEENGVHVRRVKNAMEQAAEIRSEVKAIKQKAKSLRAAAGEVFGVLTKKLQTNIIRIESIDDAPRLVVEHVKRGKTVFDHENGLSDGERVRASIDELLPHLNSPGIMEVPQRTYQDLPPADRIELAQYAADKNLYLFGAQVTDGELKVQKVTTYEKP